MIIKANRHSNGAKLADYLMNGGKHGERVESPELRGFGPYSHDIYKAFRSLHVMADAAEIKKPLFHVQVRLPEGEHITREQWEHTADRIESDWDSPARLGRWCFISTSKPANRICIWRFR